MSPIVLIIFIVAVLSVVACQLWTGVPPCPSSKAEISSVILLLKENGIKEGGLIYELGCGWGSMLLPLAKEFPDLTFIGVELSPVPCLVAKIRAWRYPNIKVRWSDFFKISLRDATAVCCYLMIAPMEPLAGKLDQELKPQTPVITVSFLFRGRSPVRVIKGRGIFKADVALYHWISPNGQMKAP